MLIIDAHLDLSWNALQWERDLLKSVAVTRALENFMPGKGRGLGTVALPEMRQGRVFVSFATLLARSTGRPSPQIDYHTPHQAFGVARGQLAYYRALEAEGHVRLIENTAQLDAHVGAWSAWEKRPSSAPPPLGFVISMEGADPILSAGQLEDWRDAGLRLLGPTHYGPGRYAGGTGTTLGLTKLGKPLLKEMRRLKIGLDLTHMSDESFWEAVRAYDGPVLASHQNARALVPHQRQFTDAQLKVVIERDGVVGASFDVWMVRAGWAPGASNQLTMANPVGLAEVVNHIDYVCQLAGNARHAAIGTDLDGGFGLEQSPRDLDSIADLQKIPPMLKARGYSDADIAGIMHGNWLRFLRALWA